MFKSLYNQARVEFTIEPVTPLLIKTGRDSFDPTRPDLEFIRTSTPFGAVPFLPGSSLKGVVRSHAERILRTVGLEACDIATMDQFCGKAGRRYAHQCWACRTFGSTRLASRLRLTDAYPWSLTADLPERQRGAGNVLLERRTNVRIDRRKGTAAGGALFEAEVVTSGAFHGEMTLRNYQLWQLALLALVLRDMNEGLQRVGAAKSRGLGRVQVKPLRWSLEQWGPLAASEELCGVGALEGLEEYDLVSGDAVAAPSELSVSTDAGLRAVFTPREGADAAAAWQALARALMGDPWQHLRRRAVSQPLQED